MSAKEGLVEFTVPESVRQVLLQIRQGNNVAELPFFFRHSFVPFALA